MPAELRCILVAQSGRALAWAARAAGLGAHVFDLCADTDTAQAALSLARVGDWTQGLCEEPLREALERVEREEPGLPLVYGSGFEDRVWLLERLAAGRVLLGCPPEALRAVNDPDRFGATLERLGIERPETGAGPAPGEGWLAKRQGGSGGGHVRWLAPGEEPGPGCYRQRWCPGLSMSALAVGDGHAAQLLGLTRHWRPEQAQAERSFRHAGLVAEPPAPALEARLRALLAALTPAFGLRGLYGVDFLLEGERLRVLEVNARPPASIELHERGAALFERHVLGARGRLLPPPGGRFRALRAQAVLYAPRALRVPPLPWPAWASDRPPDGLPIGQGEPVCTVHGAGPTVEAACARVRARLAALGDLLDGAGAFAQTTVQGGP